MKIYIPNMMNDIEIKKRKELDNLFSELEAQVSNKENIIFPDDGKPYNPTEYLCEDGFYPGYFNSKRKILFIGREARYISGCNRIDEDTNKIDGWLRKNDVNNCPFWKRIFYIAYGIKINRNVPLADIPEANEIKNEMLENNSFNFAFINISKYSNDSEENWQSNYHLINRFLKDAELKKNNYLRKEIEILDPEVIISGNLWETKIDKEALNEIFPDNDFSEYRKELSTQGYSGVYDFNFNGKKILFVDIFHFSAIKPDKEAFYDPVMKAVYS